MELITQAEKESIEVRLQALLDNRGVISTRIAEARAMGDLKENGDYHAAREQQGIEEAEIRRLQDRLRQCSIVDTNQKADFVFIGATIRIREAGSDEVELFRIVGEPTGSAPANIVEVTATSPMGEALVKARAGEVVTVRTPRGPKKFEVVEIL
jgi:transcription elongation factor GreA